MDASLKLARENTKREAIAKAGEVALVLAKSPLVQLVVFVALVEAGQMIKPNGKNQLIPDSAGTAMEAVAISSQGLQVLGTAVKEIGPAVLALAAK